MTQIKSSKKFCIILCMVNFIDTYVLNEWVLSRKRFIKIIRTIFYQQVRFCWMFIDKWNQCTHWNCSISKQHTISWTGHKGGNRLEFTEIGRIFFRAKLQKPLYPFSKQNQENSPSCTPSRNKHDIKMHRSDAEKPADL